MPADSSQHRSAFDARLAHLEAVARQLAATTAAFHVKDLANALLNDLLLLRRDFATSPALPELRPPLRGPAPLQPGDKRRTRWDRRIAVTATSVHVGLSDRDGCVGETCSGCNRPYLVGERVVAGNLHHETCPARRTA